MVLGNEGLMDNTYDGEERHRPLGVRDGGRDSRESL